MNPQQSTCYINLILKHMVLGFVNKLNLLSKWEENYLHSYTIVVSATRANYLFVFITNFERQKHLQLRVGKVTLYNV